jgi:hypothetical protein
MPDRPRKPQPETPHPDKICKSCGRAFSWRKKWARDWDVVRYCSDACRTRNSPAAATEAAALEAAILTLLAERGRDKSICPSEAAKLVATQHSAANLAAPHSPRKLAIADWQPLMEPARAAARRLVAQGRILITQQGHPVDPATAKGPIRLKLP